MIPCFALGAAFWLSASSPALASDSWSDPVSGVRVLQRVESGSSDQRIWAAFVDMCMDGAHPRATMYDEREQTTSDWAQTVGAYVAINGAFFDYTAYDAVGWSMGDGETWPTAYNATNFTSVAFGSYDRVDIFEVGTTFPVSDDWWREMVPGWPILVEEGVVVDWPCESHLCDPNPRSAVGFTQDESTLILVAVDGRAAGADGMTTAELAELMVDLGAWKALNLDGGGSTTLYVDGQVLNDPSDGSERVVSSHLGFVIVPDEEPCCVPEAAANASGVFADMADDDWATPYAEALYEEGVTTGCSASPLMFCPTCVLDRASLGVLVARAMGLKPLAPVSFADVAADAWYAPYIEALYQAGITSGCGNGNFCPDNLASRWEAAVFAFRGMGLKEATPTGMFSDVDSADAGIVEALANACVVAGCGDGLFCPDAEITRAEAAKMLAVGFSLGDFSPCVGGDTGETGETDIPDTDETDLPDTDDTAPPDTDETDLGDTAAFDSDMLRHPKGGGCGCGSATTPSLGAILGLLGLLAVARRRIGGVSS